VIQEFLRSIRTSRPGGSNLCNAALASLSIGDYTSQCTPSGRLERHAVAAALAPRLKGLNITTDLMQVGKVVTGQQL
jgi:hypothetical protein